MHLGQRDARSRSDVRIKLFAVRFEVLQNLFHNSITKPLYGAEVDNVQGTMVQGNC